MLKELETEIKFFLYDFDKTHSSITWNIDVILKNKDLIEAEISKLDMSNLSTVDDYLDYLCLCIFTTLEGEILKIESDENKKIIEGIFDKVKNKYEQVTLKMLIKFVNANYQELFSKKYHRYLLPTTTLRLILPSLKGLSTDAFTHLVQNYSELLIPEFDKFLVKFKENPELFEMLFQNKEAPDIINSYLDILISVSSLSEIEKNNQLKGIASSVIKKIEEYTDDFMKAPDSRFYNCQLSYPNEFHRIRIFFEKLKNPIAKSLEVYSKEYFKKLNNRPDAIKLNYSIPIPTDNILETLKNSCRNETRVLDLTHSPSKNDELPKSRLSFMPSKKTELIDVCGSNKPSDDYFSLHHQKKLNCLLVVSSALISTLWNDKALYSDYLQTYRLQLEYIGEKMERVEELNNDFEMLLKMLELTIQRDTIEHDLLHPSCYGAAMFTCALIEKILRIMYFHLSKDASNYYSSMTLAPLLADNGVFKGIFDESYLKNLSYFLCTAKGTKNDDKIGLNYRNNLAHWNNIDPTKVTTLLVADMFYLYTDILNTVYLYFCGSNGQTDSISLSLSNAPVKTTET